MKLKPLHRNQLITKLKKLWFDWPYTWSRHDYLKNENNLKIIIPNTHSWKDIPVPILKAIIKQMWIETNDFLEA